MSGSHSDMRRSASKFARVAASGVGVAAAGAMVAWRRSPWPSVLLLREMGRRADSGRPERLSANEALVPASVVTRALDRPYGRASSNRMDVHAPDRDGTHPTLVWVHGGGFVGGTKDDVRGYLGVMAAEGITTVGIDYTLAPKAIYPTPVLELADALEHLLGHADELGVDPEQIVLAGDSAGAHMAAQAAFAIFDAGYADACGLPRPLPASSVRALVLTSGVYDLTIGRDAKGLPGWLVRTILWAYSGQRSPLEDPRFALASLVNHVPPGLPPTYLTAGNDDPLRVHTTQFARVLRSAGTDVIDDIVTRDYEPVMPHDYQMDLRLDRARESLRLIIDLVHRTTS